MAVRPDVKGIQTSSARRRIDRLAWCVVAVILAVIVSGIGYTCFHPYIVQRPGWFLYIGEEQWGNTYDPGIGYSGDAKGGWLSIRVINFQYGVKWSIETAE